MATNEMGKSDESKASIKPKKDRAPKVEAPKAAVKARPARAPAASPFSRVGPYLREVQTELKKTNWPSKAEMIASTQIVIGLLVVVGVYIFVLDQSLAFLFTKAGLGFHGK